VHNFLKPSLELPCVQHTRRRAEYLCKATNSDPRRGTRTQPHWVLCCAFAKARQTPDKSNTIPKDQARLDPKLKVKLFYFIGPDQ